LHSNFVLHDVKLIIIINITFYYGRRDSIVGIATGYGLDEKKGLEFESR
jgi:hypothetical protein